MKDTPSCLLPAINPFVSFHEVIIISQSKTCSARRQTNGLVLPIINKPFHVGGGARTAGDEASRNIQGAVTGVKVVNDEANRIAHVFASDTKENSGGSKSVWCGFLLVIQRRREGRALPRTAHFFGRSELGGNMGRISSSSGEKKPTYVKFIPSVPGTGATKKVQL